MRWLLSLLGIKPQLNADHSQRMKPEEQPLPPAAKPRYVGPKGGVYTVDARGRKRYIKA